MKTPRKGPKILSVDIETATEIAVSLWGKDLTIFYPGQSRHDLHALERLPAAQV